MSCAAAVSIVERIDDKLLQEVKEKSAWVFEQFKGADGVSDVTGLGLMIGIKPEKKTASEVINACMQKGVLCLSAKDKVRLLPALNIPFEVLKEAAEIIKEAIAE